MRGKIGGGAERLGENLVRNIAIKVKKKKKITHQGFVYFYL